MDHCSFIRKSFYINPPTKNSSAEDWANWVEADEREARKAKSRFTRSRNKAEDVAELPHYSTRKVDGAYKQVVSIGFSGEGEAGPTREARQEVNVDKARAILNTMTATSRSYGRNRNKAKRERIRQARKAKYQNRG